MYVDSPTSFQFEESCACEAIISHESGSGALQKSSSAAPWGLRLDRFNPRDRAALVDFSAADPYQRQAPGAVAIQGSAARKFLSEPLRGGHAFSQQATCAIASAEHAPGLPHDEQPSSMDPGGNVSFFPDLESRYMSGGGREFRVGIGLPEPQEVHTAVDAAVALPQLVTAKACASDQGDAPAKALAPQSSVAPLDPDAMCGRPATTMVVRNVPQRVTKQEFLEDLNRSGFAGAYDFAYLPRDLNSNLGKGFAFVNFIQLEAAAAFAAAWHRTYRFGVARGDGIPLNVTASAVQGFQANVEKWTSQRRGRVNNQRYLPFVKVNLLGSVPR
jgi:hypothetical protein